MYTSRGNSMKDTTPSHTSTTFGVFICRMRMSHMYAKMEKRAVT